MPASNLPPVDEVPAAHLSGRQLANGWTVGALIQRGHSATGGNFSVCYEAHKEDGQRGFLKALNFSATITGSEPLVDQVNRFTSAFIYERDLLAHCAGRRLSRVIRMLDSGEADVPEAGSILSRVPYLILEFADGDLRAFQRQLQTFDTAWVFRVMKHAAQGIEQLHSAHAAHQDLKPSNVLIQAAGREMKLGDLGRAERRGVDGPWNQWRIPGAVAYAPPEQLYGAFGLTWEERRAADVYLVGSLGVQLFIGHCMSAMLEQRIPSECHARNWHGSFQEVLPYLRRAQLEVMESLREQVAMITGDSQATGRYIAAIQQLTEPDPKLRGHPRDRAASTSSYDLRRYVSTMDLLMKGAELKLQRNVGG